MKKQLILLILIFIITIKISKGKTLSGYDILNYISSGNTIEEANITALQNSQSFYNNPSLLYTPDKNKKFNAYRNEFYLSYSRLKAGINSLGLFSTLNFPFINKIGIGFTGLLLDNLIETTYNGEDEYSLVNKGTTLLAYTITIGYGNKFFLQNLQGGVNLKIADEIIGGHEVGMGIDIGALYSLKNFKVALTFNNIGASLKNYKDNIFPVQVNIGGEYNLSSLLFHNIKLHTLKTYEKIGYEIINENLYSYTGLEYLFHNIIFSRILFYYDIEKNYKIAGGIGIKYKKNLKFDYTISFNNIGIEHKIGAGIIFTTITHQEKKDNIDNLDLDIKLDIKEISGKTYINLGGDEIFVKDKAIIKKNAQHKLDRVVDELEKKKNKTIKIYVCLSKKEEKNPEYNIKLATQRAKQIYNYFINKGIDKKRMEYKGLKNTKNIKRRLKNASMIQKNGCVQIIISRLNKKEKEKFDYYYFTGMDYEIKGMKEEALKNWEKALKIDPQNEELKLKIKKLKQSIKK